MFFTVLTILVSLNEVRPASIDGRDGGYNVVVALHESVPPANLIIQNIKVLFRKGSQLLHQVTYGKFFFKHVTIVLPSTWPQTSERQVTGDSLFLRADIRVSNTPSGGSGSRPFTRHQRGCGERGEYIQVPTEFLVSMNLSSLAECGSPVFLLTHEWARFRYGVFEDSGHPSDNGCLSFCTEGLQVFRFCEDDGDDDVAPTRDSYYGTCPFKSAWALIKHSNDFHEFQGPALDTEPDVIFHEIQHIEGRGRRYVFLFDTSSKMEPSLLSLVKRSAIYIIRSIFMDGDRLSIVSLKEGSHIKHPLAVISPSTRENIVNVIRSLTPGGDTCVACGVDRFMRVLMSQGESPDGASVCIFWGSNLNRSEDTTHIFPPILEKNVVLHTFDFVFEGLYRLALKTGGKAYFFGGVENASQMALETSLTDVVYSSLPEWQQPVVLLKTSETIMNTLTRSFIVPFELGNKTTVRIVGRARKNLAAHLVSESGIKCTDCTVIKDDVTSSSFAVIIPSPAQSGKWQLTLTAGSREPADVGILVQSFQKDLNTAATRAVIYFGRRLVTAGSIPVIYVKITKGNDVVRHADVVVMVTPPDASSQARITLRDDGLGYDVQRGDGVYTTSFVGNRTRGLYAVHADITVVEEVAPGMNPRRRNPTLGFVQNDKSAHLVSASYQQQGNSSQYTTTHLKTIPTYDWDNPVPRVELKFKMVPGVGFVILETVFLENFAPSRIGDLLIIDYLSRIERENPLVPLRWTSMGAYGTKLRASFIEIRISENEERLVNNFTKATLITWDNVVNGSLIPIDPWKFQDLVIRVPPELLGDEVDRVFIGMRYWNNRSRVGFLSNIVYVWISERVVTSKTSRTSASSMITSEASTKPSTQTASHPSASTQSLGTTTRAAEILPTLQSSTLEPQATKPETFILLGSVLLILLVTIICAAYVIASRRKKEAEHCEVSRPSGTTFCAS